MKARRVELGAFTLSMVILTGYNCEMTIVTPNDETVFFGSMAELITESTRETPYAMPKEFNVLGIEVDHLQECCKVIIDEI